MQQIDEQVQDASEVLAFDCCSAARLGAAEHAESVTSYFVRFGGRLWGYCVGPSQVHVKLRTRTLSRNTLSPIG